MHFSVRMLNFRSFVENSDITGNTVKILPGNYFLPVIPHQLSPQSSVGAERRPSRHAEAQNCASHAPFLRKLLKDTPQQNNGIGRTVAGRHSAQNSGRETPVHSSRQRGGRPRRGGGPRKGNRTRQLSDVFERLEKIHHDS